MVVELASAGYVILRDKVSAKEAEAWLRATLAGTAAAIRLRGSDALVKIDITIHEVPNKIAPKSSPLDPPAATSAPAAAAPAAPPVACACEKDSSGRCDTCPDKIAKTFKEFFSHFRKLASFAGRMSSVCKQCQKDHIDYAISTIVDDLFDISGSFNDEKKAEFAQELLAALFQMVTVSGEVKEMPLTLEAWKKAVEKQGLAVEGV